MKQAKGFTLIELMIVVVVIAILASIAIPSYSRYVTRSKVPEATSNLAALRVQMEQYYQDTRSYITAGGACGIGAVPAATANFTYACVGTTTTYFITASGSGSMSGFSYVVNELNVKTSAMSGQAAAAGWAAHSPNTCWVTKTGGAC